MTATYWEIGRRIVEFEQGGSDRTAYGDALIKRLGEDLSARFGRGFAWRNLTSRCERSTSHGRRIGFRRRCLQNLYPSILRLWSQPSLPAT
ncbi:MAG TPA: DUF1016 N-terminal domain-containing protein [Bordetella sp.]|nr:DUF1016 N-terminal domain-containing protein [Bordetella sp.]